MDRFLTQINLSTDFSLTLPINGTDFVNKLKKTTTASTIEALTNADKIFIGNVTTTQLSLRTKSGLTSSTRLTAKIEDTSSTFKVEGRITLSKYSLFFISLLFFVFLIAFILIIQENTTAGIIMFFQFLLMLAVFYFVFRHAIKKSKLLFEKELYFLTNNSH